MSKESTCLHCEAVIVFDGQFSGSNEVWDDHRGDYCCAEDGPPHQPKSQ